VTFILYTLYFIRCHVRGQSDQEGERMAFLRQHAHRGQRVSGGACCGRGARLRPGQIATWPDCDLAASSAARVSLADEANTSAVPAAWTLHSAGSPARM